MNKKTIILKNGYRRRIEHDVQQGIIIKRGITKQIVKEHRNLLLLNEFGVSVPKVIGYQMIGKKAILRMKYIENAEPLNQIVDKLSSRTKYRIAELLGKEIAKLHNVGFFHHDLHPGNVLISQNAGKLKVTIIDVHRAKWSKPTKKRILDNLSLLYAAIFVRTNLRISYSFLKGYIRAIQLSTNFWPGENVKEQIASFNEIDGYNLRIMALKRMFKRLKKRVKIHEKRHLKRCRVGSYTGFVFSKYYEKTHMKPMINYLGANDQSRRSRNVASDRVVGCCVLKNGRSSLVVVTNGLCFKHFKPRTYKFLGLKDLIRVYLRMDKARKCFEWAVILRILGFNTPQPLGYFSKLNGESVLVTRYLEDARPLEKIASNITTDANKREFLGALASFLNQVLTYGFWHKDLKSSNILVVWRQHDFEFYLIDLFDLHHSIPFKIKQVKNSIYRLVDDLAGYFEDDFLEDFIRRSLKDIC